MSKLPSVSVSSGLQLALVTLFRTCHRVNRAPQGSQGLQAPSENRHGQAGPRSRRETRYANGVKWWPLDPCDRHGLFHCPLGVCFSSTILVLSWDKCSLVCRVTNLKFQFFFFLTFIQIYLRVYRKSKFNMNCPWIYQWLATLFISHLCYWYTAQKSISLMHTQPYGMLPAAVFFTCNMTCTCDQ